MKEELKELLSTMGLTLSEEKTKVTHITDIEQVLGAKKLFTLRCMLDCIKELQGRVAQWNRFVSSVSIT